MNAHAFLAALQWYADQGVDEAIAHEPQNRLKIPSSASLPPVAPAAGVTPLPTVTPLLGAKDARAEAVKLAAQAGTLSELQEIIRNFEGLSLKKTATQMVFADGNSKAHIMLIGDAPATDEDRIGIPFAGECGVLLDKMFAAINLSRKNETPETSIYISNILNWRPPGNRTPSAAEIEVSLPFIERHIQLVAPKILVFCGGVAAQSLLGRSESISRLRKVWHAYTPRTLEFQSTQPEIQSIAIFHPNYLIQNPAQKRAAWEDLQSLQEKLKTL
jgi:DNA polymerase